MGARQQFGQRPAEIVVAETETIHPGVDFQVIAQRGAMLRGRRLHRARRRRRRDRRRQRILEQTLQIADAQRTKDKDRQAHAGAPQHHALFDVRTGEHRRPRLLERDPHGPGSVPVGVGFDNGDDRRAAGSGLRAAGQERSNRSKVGLQRAEVDVRDSAADHQRNRESRIVNRERRIANRECERRLRPAFMIRDS
jgi:hypothetical protein